MSIEPVSASKAVEFANRACHGQMHGRVNCSIFKQLYDDGGLIVRNNKSLLLRANGGCMNVSKRDGFGDGHGFVASSLSNDGALSGCQ